jgi:ABC-type transport system involved in multi-copper enzyme maturation permease subunit
MLASVFQLEMLLAGRRQRAYVLRWIYAAFVLALLAPFLYSDASLQIWIETGGFAAFFERLIVLHFGLLFLLTPAMTCGAVTDEKTTGTLQYLLTAPLSPLEIVLGKLSARTLHLALLAMAGLPLLGFFAGVAGDPSFPIALVVISFACIFGIASVCILASVWCRTTRDAMLSIYLGGVALVLLRNFAAWPRFTSLWDQMHPLRALAADDAAQRWQRLGPCLLAWFVLGALAALCAALRMRRAYTKQLEVVPARRARWVPAWRPRVGVNPVLWRERYIEGISPLPFLRRWPRWCGVIAVFVATLSSFGLFLYALTPARLPGFFSDGFFPQFRAALQANPVVDAIFYWHGLAALALASFVMAVRVSGSVTGEREHGTWLGLLLTPIATRSILRGKHWGIFLAFAPHLAAYAAAALSWSLFVGAAATAWTLLWLLATFFAVQYVGAIGIWCSVRSTNTWLSLIMTLTWGYLSWIVFAVPVGLLLLVGQAILEQILAAINEAADVSTALAFVQSHQPLYLALGGALILAFWFLTHRLLVSAERTLIQRDRGKEADPQFDHCFRRWLRQIEAKRQQPPTIEPALDDNPLPLADDEPTPAEV